MSDSLELRKDLKKKRPTFLRTSVGVRKRVSLKWRKPKGSDNKMRHQLKGYPRVVKNGYGCPKDVRGLHDSGLKIIVVSNIKDLESVDPKTEGVIISSNVGDKKKITIINKCSELKIKLLNVKDVEKLLKDMEQKFSSRKEAKKKKTESKTEKEKEKEKKAAEKEKKDAEEKAKEEKKGEEGLADKLKEEEEKKKEEQNKVLTKKE